MPTYDYQCQACEHPFTAMHKISDATPQCPECGGEVRKKLTAAAIRNSRPSSMSAVPCCGAGGCGCHRPQ